MAIKSTKEMVKAANAELEVLTAEQAIALHGADDITFVDIRDIRELWRDGAVPGAWHVPRGMLEFWIDPDSPYAKEEFRSGKKFVFFCAGGMRSALATKIAADMGLEPVAHIETGFGGWKKAGGPVETVEPKQR
ncbi:Rhodanese-related sulfurtransferase [Albimonas donghaensis]|uniref:Rhodanese-related sulfurtransferase n=1 Tax=Albimonas donghaensis TaxID=356660 RepID=A0A1H3E6N7_9RHOB|nr:rhodanese-like domain-containing protein [Albimonas donghaensis]MAS43691.1 rhodanese-like domain-containing protein [Paracoccaceae bacterium]MBR27738.1 rhodanese-like domain-containing protein [Paracoccaceae bacterium]SDX74356.1 Rhodanese-related sulfurtransferase [Albimonas donghaensis]